MSSTKQVESIAQVPATDTRGVVHVVGNNGRTDKRWRRFERGAHACQTFVRGSDGGTGWGGRRFGVMGWVAEQAKK